MSEKQQKLVFAIIDFLRRSIDDGTVKSDDRESLEVAIQCIGEAFNVDPSNEEQVNKLDIKPATLQSVFDVFLKTRDKVGGTPQSSIPSNPGSSSKLPSDEDKAKAEEFKKIGNSHMSKKSYDEAIKSYDDAIVLDPHNPIYYSNRAAAYSSKGDHLSAVGDAEKAISLDSKFTKAYHRLGHAQYSIGDYAAAADAFKQGLEIEPDNQNLKSGLQNSKARIVPDAETSSSSGGPNISDLLGAGAGGVPDMASLMNNPALMSMAQQMMANGGLERLMSNPAVADMMDRVQSGGGMPSMAELMNNPALRDLAGQFGGAGAGGPR